MRKLVTVLGLLALAITLSSMTASAGTAVVILGSSSQNVTFTSNGGGTALVQLGSCGGGTCTLSGNAFDNVGDSGGTYTFTTTGGDLLAGGLIPPSSSLHTLSANGTSTTFSVAFADGDSLSGNIVWSDVNDGSPNPRLEGTITSITVSGDSAWTSLFAGVSSANFDMTLNTMSCTGLSSGQSCSLDSIEADTAATGANSISSGEVVVPEPSTLLLLGTGLLGLGGAIRRRFLAA